MFNVFFSSGRIRPSTVCLQNISLNNKLTALGRRYSLDNSRTYLDLQVDLPGVIALVVVGQAGVDPPLLGVDVGEGHAAGGADTGPGLARSTGARPDLLVVSWQAPPDDWLLSFSTQHPETGSVG